MTETGLSLSHWFCLCSQKNMPNANGIAWSWTFLVHFPIRQYSSGIASHRTISFNWKCVERADLNVQKVTRFVYLVDAACAIS